MGSSTTQKEEDDTTTYITFTFLPFFTFDLCLLPFDSFVLFPVYPFYFINPFTFFSPLLPIVTLPCPALPCLEKKEGG